MAYQLPLDFGRDTERKGQNLAGNVVTETVVVLHCPDFGSDFHTMIENRHDHEERPSEPADFGADDDIIFLDTLQQFAQAPFVDLFRSACCLTNPFVDLQTVVTAEPLYFKSLVLYSLPVSTDSVYP